MSSDPMPRSTQGRTEMRHAVSPFTTTEQVGPARLRLSTMLALRGYGPNATIQNNRSQILPLPTERSQFRQRNVIRYQSITHQLALFGFDLIQHRPDLTHSLIPNAGYFDIFVILIVETVETVEWVETLKIARPRFRGIRLVMSKLHMGHSMLVSLMPSPRRFPAPWSSELQPDYYVVHGAEGQQLAYIYYSNDPDRRSAAKLLRRDEALLSGEKS